MVKILVCDSKDTGSIPFICLCLCSSVGLEYLIENQTVIGSSPITDKLI